MQAAVSTVQNLSSDQSIPTLTLDRREPLWRSSLFESQESSPSSKKRKKKKPLNCSEKETKSPQNQTITIRINNSKLQAGRERERERERERIRSLQRKKPKQKREREGERERGRGRRHKTWGGHDGGGKVILLSARVCTMVSAIAKFNLIGFQWVPVGSLVVEHWVVAQTG